MEKHDLKDYVQGIQNKISIAVALALIKAKPKNTSAREYASSLQEKILQNWMKKPENTEFEDKILELQQHKIFGLIKDLLPPPQPLLNSVKSVSDALSDIPDVCTDLCWPESCSSTESDSDSESSESTVHKNINFIQAMVQLKFAVESSKRISTERVHSLIIGKSVVDSDTKELLTEELLFGHHMCSEDSGYGGSSSFIAKDTNSVSTNAFRFVTHSYKTEALIQKCIISLLNHVKKAFLCQSGESFKSWKGSVLEHVTSVFKEVSDNYICSQVVSKFVLEIIENVWSSKDTGSNLNWEYQLSMVSEFCFNTFISETTIHFIMEKLNILGSNLSKGNTYDPDNWDDIYIIEKTPLFLSMLSVVLKKWNDHKKPTPTEKKEENHFTSITNQWKKNFGEDNKVSIPVSDLDTLRRWKGTLEELVASSSQLFPLISYQVWECIESLDSWMIK